MGDLRYAVRLILKRPGFSLLIVLILGILGYVGEMTIYILLAGILGSVVVVTVYSYYVWKNDPDRKETA